MKLSFCTIAFQKNKWGQDRTLETPLPAILPVLAAAGYDGVEIWEPHVHDFRDAALDDLRRQLADLRLAVPMLSPYFDFTTSEETAAQSLADARRALVVARRIGATGIRCFTGKTASQDATPEQWARAARCLQTLADESAADGIAWVLEIHSWNLMDTIAGTQRLLRETDRKNVGIIYHPGNLLPDYIGAIDVLAPAIKHVHAHNRRDGKGSGLAEGELDYRQIIPRLRQVGYTGYLSVEWFGDDAPGVARKEAVYLRSLLLG
jgi:sugar phosphate isomerase/epimerase